MLTKPHSLLLILFLIAQVDYSLAQYAPILRTDVYWEIEFTYQRMHGSYASHTEGFEISNTDTLINGNKYKKYSFSETYLLREDTAKGVLYRYLPWKNQEVVLMDLSLEVGDTIAPIDPRFYLFPTDTLKYYVYRTGQLVIEGDTRKYVAITPINQPTNFEGDKWIEGIGSIKTGPIFTNSPVFAGNNSLICYTKKGLNPGEVPVPIYGYRCSPTNISFEESKRVSFYPNPAREKIKFQGLKDNTPFIVLVFDAKGRMILKKELISEDSIEIPFPDGIYLLQLWSKNKLILSEKIVKQ